MVDLTALVLAMVLLLGNAFFVGAEFALISTRRSRVEPLAEAGNRRAAMTLRAMERVSLMMAGAQLGITVCSLGLGAVGEPAVARMIEPLFEFLGLPAGLVHAVALVIALAVVVYFHMVVGEMVPKNIALAGPERAALVLGPALWFVVSLLRPVIWLLNASANAVLRVLRVEPREEVASAFTVDEVAGMIDESRRHGLLDREEHELLSGALEYSRIVVAAVAVRLDRVATVAAGATADDIERRTADTGYSRFPVVTAEGEFQGYVHVKDVLDVMDPDTGESTAAPPVRPLPRIAMSEPIDRAVQTLAAQGSHLALAVDAGDGSARGILTMQDAVAALVAGVGHGS